MKAAEETIRRVEKAVASCTKCGLCRTRTHAVPGEGSLNAVVMFVGEGPGHDEDLQGRPFVGPAGQLLDRMIGAIGLSRSDVYIANVVKCRPPNNRNPEPEEAEACLPYLRAQFSAIRPKIIVCLGAVSSRHLISSEIRITRDRGKWFRKGSTWFLPTYHPAALLRDESKKRAAWKDMQMLSEKIRDITLFETN